MPLKAKSDFHKACKSGAVPEVSSHTSDPQFDVNGADNFGHTGLTLAASGNHLPILTLLLARQDIDVNLPDRSGKTALFIACSEGYLDAAKLLVAHPAVDVNLAERMGATPLHAACKEGRADLVQLLMQHPAIDPNKKDRMNRLPVDVARAKKSEDVVALLLSSSAVLDRSGKTVLHRAVDDRDLEAVKAAAIDPQTNLNQADRTGQTPFYLACKTGFLEAVAYFLTLPDAAVNQGNVEKLSPISAACQSGHLEVVRLLAASERIEFPSTLLVTACKGRHTALARELIADPRIDPDLHKAILTSCWEGDADTVRFLLTQEALPLDFDYLPVAEGQWLPQIEGALHERVAAQLAARDADQWSEVDVSNWVVVKLGLSPKLALLFRNNHVTGELLVKSFKNEDDLNSITFQAQERVLVFKEKEALRLQLEIKRGESEEIKFNDSDVFISYCWANATLVRDTATRLSSAEHGLEVWLDIKKMRGNIYDAMENGVRNSKVFIAFISPQYAASANCQRELKLGNDLRKKIICCLVDPANRFENGGWPPPGIGTLVAGSLYVDLTKNFEDNFKQLLSQVKTILSPPPLAPATPAPATPAPAPAPAPAAVALGVPPKPAHTVQTAPDTRSPEAVAAFMSQILDKMTEISAQVASLDKRLGAVERRLDSMPK